MPRILDATVHVRFRVTELDAVIDLAIPSLVWLLMLVVGLDLTPTDFRRVLRHPLTVGAATVGQLLVLPACAALLVWILEPAPWIVAGLVLLAASPGGAISNMYTYLGHGNVALSVTLTGVSTLLGALTMPVLTTFGLMLFFDPSTQTTAPPLGRMIGQLVLMILLPLALGMTLRARRPAAVARAGQALRLVSLAALAALVGLILLDQRDGLTVAAAAALPVALPFCLMTMLAGFTLGGLLQLESDDRFALLIEFGTRNLGLVAIMGGLILGNLQSVLFATLVFLVELPLVLALIVLRTHQPKHPRHGS
jgi:BASS family bile acid:Na+ symporter